MTTKDLITVLNRLDPAGTMRVLAIARSDYHLMEDGEIRVAEAVEKPTARYVMRSHRSMPDEDKAKAENFIVFESN